MARKNKTFDVTPVEALALAIETFNQQGFIRSGEGFKQTDYETGEVLQETKDNKTIVIEKITAGFKPSEELISEAKEIIDKFNGRYMLKKLTSTLSNFEQGVAQAFDTKELTNFNVAVLASIPHMNEVDKKRKAVEDKIEELRFESEFFGDKGQRYDLQLEVIDVKYIQSSSVYMITTVQNSKNIVKFWWRDQPDISDIIDGKVIHVRGTVNKHEKSKYTNAHETMINRVKIYAK
tara:strand:- start:2133 stop:2837 length:705 start_codon:yes stop_codon:yes gene_type:complete